MSLMVTTSLLGTMSLGALPVVAMTESNETAETGAGQTSGLGIIKGVVRDHAGKPIVDATVALFRTGSSKALRQVRSAADGSFILRVIPGKYSVFAVAQGFNPVSMPEVEVGRSSELNYGFKLERAGSGNTLPERRIDRSNPKWMIRSAGISRSIYQNSEGDLIEAAEEYVPVDERERDGRQTQSVASTYFVGSEAGNYVGINIATLIPLGRNAEVVVAGQTGVGANAPSRLESQLKFRPVENHQVRVNASVSGYGNVNIDKESRSLGQISLQVLDEWRVREGIVFVYGVDYSQFVGAGDAFSITPRLGFQYDLDARTRFRTAYTSQTEERTWARAIELEDAQVAFREPVSVTDFVVEEGKPLMNTGSRFELGIERVLDNRSSLDLNAFFDMTTSKG
ncbi:MAG: carboxypeptidase regulatory-like domain-containing protein, partial [Blastocatellia bacterium]|nr:carboxypeptidase regulatory-like domain-containing protein [Blastocatellia bacterium]